MQFFQHFPKIGYTTLEYFDGSPQYIQREIPNMTIKLELNVLQDGLMEFDTYRVKDGDRPDTIAAQLYGNSRYAWVILLANNMKDWYDWPLTEQEFYVFICKKYESFINVNDGFSESKSSIYQYIKILADGREVVIDRTEYNSLSVSERRAITYYDHEFTLNDIRRLIRLPALSTLNEIVRQFNVAMTQ